MYKEIKKSWNPFVGCNFNCIYCKPSFQKHAKRQLHRCRKCYDYFPHFHPERLKQYLPKNSFIFACDMGDISFANDKEIKMIFDEMGWRTHITFLIQSKNPICFADLKIPSNVIIGTTIETNRNTTLVSKAPQTYIRQAQIKNIKHGRKSVTIEPIMKFDLPIMVNWVEEIEPERVWIGYNNYPEKVQLDEPSLEETKQLISELQKITHVSLKTIREKASYG